MKIENNKNKDKDLKQLTSINMEKRKCDICQGYGNIFLDDYVSKCPECLGTGSKLN